MGPGCIPSQVQELIEKFSAQADLYRSPTYNETQLRVDFVNPMFKALGWDIDNTKGFAEAFREVVHEDAVRIAGTVKSPDYSFRIGGRRIFFLEAKKPAVNIRDDTEPAYQLRRYAWTAGLPVSILTDFEEFAVYDCRVPPKYLDKASTARLWYFTYKDYPQRWDQIASIFSPDAIQHGAMDRWVQSNKKSGTQEFDDAFLDEMEEWRKKLASNLALRNDRLDQGGLNFATQRIIDRIVFLRICEDRGIEPPFQLQGLLSGENVYARLLTLFRKADARYNSGLFHFQKERDRHEQPDELTPRLAVDDGAVKHIIKRLYYPDSPYVFKEVAADILGSVYERFLGNVIHLTAGHHAKVEPKPEVRKAGGVYYTPTYIVDYIVQNTVGRLLGDGESKTGSGASGSGVWGLGYGVEPPHPRPQTPDPRPHTPHPKDAAKLKILDPACGSGSFLLGAYQYLLNWHQRWYLNNDPARWSRGRNATLRPGPAGQPVLSIRERKRILTDNIFGVDLDPAAVEVTKLSLLLKCLEGESAESINDLLLFHERALPDLGDNIKCGNSLISTDIYESDAWKKLSEEERARLRPFDWEREFPAVMKAGGFDAVIGNPPYIRIHNLVDFAPVQATYIQSSRFESTCFGKIDIYVAFVERALSLLRRSGRIGFIVPNKFMQADYGVGVRRLIARRQSLDHLVDFGSAQVFPNATTYTCLIFLSGSPQAQHVAVFNPDDEAPSDVLNNAPREAAPNSILSDRPWTLGYAAPSCLMKKIESVGKPLKQFVDLGITGVKTGANHVYTFSILKTGGKLVALRPEDGNEDQMIELERAFLRPYCKAESMKRYAPLGSHRLLLYPYEERDGQTYLVGPEAIADSAPRTWAHLRRHRTLLEQRQKGDLKGPAWYGLSFASSIRMFRGPKITTPTLAPRNAFSIDTGHFFPQGAGGGCGLILKEGVNPSYVLGILNSKLLTFHFQRISSRFQGGWFAYEPRYLMRMPIRPIDFCNKKDKSSHDRLVSLVDQMLALHKSLAAAQSPSDKEALQRQIDATDRQIDRLVYELYGLSDEEIRIVEEATG